MKQTVNNVQNEVLAKYNHDFFKTFSSNVIKSMCLNQSKLALSCIPKFHSVTDLESFKTYLKDTPGLYSQLCLWTIKNPFSLGKIVIQINHHLTSKFLYRDPFYKSTKKQLNYSYNIVSISWLIHFLMHLTRLVEYARQFQDELSLKVITKQKSNRNDDKENLMFELWNLFKPLASMFSNLFGYFPMASPILSSREAIRPDLKRQAEPENERLILV